ncbi:lactonase family protein [Frondihabitans cladoniiphilus]|uniref:Lactonase family protein n=1 Tax=Frondihabitans cladoniiphilus TaxID=715785 RepID=A0ABP8W4S5_9MICO
MTSSTAPASSPLRLFLGAYTPTSGGHGTGISVLDRATPDAPWHATQIVAVDDPSFLALTEGALHAVSESTEGRVVSYTISAGSLVASSVAASGGAAPCHVVIDPASGALVVADYTAGTIGVLSADASDPARVTRTLALPVGRGPVVDRQDHAHAHSTVPTPWGTMLVSDLGTDRVFEVRIDPVTLDPSFVATHPLPAGSGPRHFAWLGSQLLVTGELDARLHVLSYADGRFTVDYSVAAYDPALAPSAVGFAGATDAGGTGPLPSHVEVFDGRVYVAVRGRDTITVLAPGGSGGSPGSGGSADGAVGSSSSGASGEHPERPERLAVVAEVPCGGRWPRHFAAAPGALYVANQLSDTVAILPLDPATGIPGAPSVLIETGSPTCVVFG